MPSSTRIAVIALVLCSLGLTVRERLILNYPQLTLAASWSGREYTRTDDLAAIPGASEILPSRQASTRVTPGSLPQRPWQHSPPPLPATSSKQQLPEPKGWKRTLPANIFQSATWFSRERTLDAIFTDVPAGGVVWLTFANWAFRELALNWASHVYRLQVERAVGIAALDVPFQRLLLGEQLPYFAFDHGMTGDLRSNVSGFRRLGALKGTLVLKVLRAERHVLLSDVDVVWLTNPVGILADLARHADVMSATDCLHVTADERKFPERKLGTNRCA